MPWGLRLGIVGRGSRELEGQSRAKARWIQNLDMSDSAGTLRITQKSGSVHEFALLFFLFLHHRTQKQHCIRRERGLSEGPTYRITNAE